MAEAEARARVGRRPFAFPAGSPLLSTLSDPFLSRSSFPLRSISLLTHTLPSPHLHPASTLSICRAASLYRLPVMSPLARPETIAVDHSGVVPGLSGGITFAGQDKLPHLPIPPLADTMKRYLRALEGLQVSSSLTASELESDQGGLGA